MGASIIASLFRSAGSMNISSRDSNRPRNRTTTLSDLPTMTNDLSQMNVSTDSITTVSTVTDKLDEMNVSGKPTASMIVNKCDEKNHALQFPMRDCPWDFSYIDYGRESITVNGFRLGHQYDSSIPPGKVNLSAEVAKQLGVVPGSKINIVLHNKPAHNTDVNKVWESNFSK
ncbi:MAG: hypothetical protein Terrestrivirus4_160 [Terrestrivirus sp.]|uniref:Uncharacterized protein n=1 Tax=Terrestrivirus sp. TaxID=2487775 RepID=A0A3G4ZMN0_9VIRU|nr:MAG: hypothetical protein Terrestrivirus4_160 [Terrestrivirus sp.]